MHSWGIPLTLAYVALFTWLINRSGHFKSGNYLANSPGKRLITLFFGYKLLMGLALTLIYTYYYGNRHEADIYKYFDDSLYMTQALWQKPVDFFKMLFGIGNDTQYFTDTYYAKMDNWFRKFETQQYNDNHTIIRFNAVVRLFSGGYFHVHTVFMCFLSFWGTMSFFKGFSLFLPQDKQKWMAFALFLFPSFTFWSAGVLKEGLLIFALGNIFYAVCLLCERSHRWGYYLLGLFSVWISLYLKSYALAAMMVGLSGVMLCSLLRYKYVTAVYAVVAGGFLLALYLMTLWMPQYNIPVVLAQKQENFIRFSEAVKAGSIFNIGQLEPTWGSVVSLSPMALVTGLFRPFVFEANGNPLMLLSSLESLLFLAGFIGCIVFFDRPGPSKLSLVIGSFFIIGLLSVIIGLSTVNFGSLVRYKIPLIPFVIYVCVCLIDGARIKKLFGHSQLHTSA